MFFLVSIVVFVTCSQYVFSPRAIIKIVFHKPLCVAQHRAQPILEMTTLLNTQRHLGTLLANFPSQSLALYCFVLFSSPTTGSLVLHHLATLTLYIPVVMGVYVTFSLAGRSLRLSAADGVKFCWLIGIIINDLLHYGMKAVRQHKVRAVIYRIETKSG